VAYATARHGGQYASAVIDYGSYVCQYETGVDDIPRFDAHLEVFGTDRVLRVQYDTPYVRNLPIRLSVTAANGRGGVEVHTEHPEWGDAFTAEWLALHDSIARRAEPSASPADFRRDLELFADMVELMAAADPVAS
jgi:predicted dehydrogenase